MRKSLEIDLGGEGFPSFWLLAVGNAASYSSGDACACLTQPVHFLYRCTRFRLSFSAFLIISAWSSIRFQYT